MRVPLQMSRPAPPGVPARELLFLKSRLRVHQPTRPAAPELDRCRRLCQAVASGEPAMRTPVERRTVDLSRYPDLVVVYLGMRVNRIAGLKTLFGFGPQIAKSVE